jgi:hypothetical protein
MSCGCGNGTIAEYYRPQTEGGGSIDEPSIYQPGAGQPLPQVTVTASRYIPPFPWWLLVAIAFVVAKKQRWL